jgi:hypothetical protein
LSRLILEVLEAGWSLPDIEDLVREAGVLDYVDVEEGEREFVYLLESTYDLELADLEYTFRLYGLNQFTLQEE